MSQKCPNCEGRISDEAFCPNCGIAQQCINCETPFKAEENFCGMCGRKRHNPSIIEEAKKQDPSAGNAKVQQTASEERPTNKKLSPIIIGIFVLVVVILLIFVIKPFSKSDEKKVEEVVSQFFDALEDADFEKTKSLIHPRTEYMDLHIDNFYYLYDEDLSIDILDFDITYIDDTDADVETFISFYHPVYDETERDDFYFELKKFKKQWLIYDFY